MCTLKVRPQIQQELPPPTCSRSTGTVNKSNAISQIATEDSKTFSLSIVHVL